MNLLPRTTSNQADHSPIPKRIVITKINNANLPSDPSRTLRTLKPRSRTQPIPIKPAKTTRFDFIESNEAVDRAHYELATWNMYVLITNARRLRAANRVNNSSLQSASGVDASVEEQSSAPQAYRDQESAEPRSTDLDDLSYDECYDDIFELDSE